MFLVIEVRGTETGFVGPFDSCEAARSWAAARSEAVESDRGGTIEVAANGDAVTLLAPANDVVAEWLVEPMTDPSAV